MFFSMVSRYSIYSPVYWIIWYKALVSNTRKSLLNSRDSTSCREWSYFSERKWTESLMISVLILSLLNVCNGLMGWLSHRLLFPMVFEHEILIMPSDAVRELCRILFVLCSFTIILSRFGPSLMETNWQTLFQLTIPVFFISLVERIIQEAFYGDVIEVDHYTHEILPVVAVDHIELLFLQIFACICLVMMLFAYEKIIKILHAEQKVQLLERQAAEQEIYIQEAMMRYKADPFFPA